ncbi:sugar ABC transporter substrate-binding protein [Beijerinckia indica]|uniref:Periplasmic binding protein/LacI transcriptional regulator n=1 Tax=Beijerinckia indica subsp. indica (strain ATCC 9039 / DSM 1715 / NCIMB 8712) TaxID=395963 RepID=B2IJW8_BEII9|nr:sugar ABC transporter substrate-binding protein [Beijerinckia indica]ACB96343.1 periplasmic binding protein/LacI transcriptional regulator [Beijerinckia indica subsp. indica ATCC 9039]
MKRILLAAVMAINFSCSAGAESIGVSMSAFDDNFLTVLRNALIAHGQSLPNVNVQMEDAQNDVARQQSQVQNFIASGVSAIIVNPVDTDATEAISKLAADAKVPLVYVNRQPANVDRLPETQAFIASDEAVSGTLQAQEVCRLLKARGKGKSANVVVMMGQLSNQASRQRTKDVHDVIATPECAFMKVVEEQTANWQRTEAMNLMSNWLSAGIQFDAVIANADEMAIGAIQAMRSAGLPVKDYIVAGIDGGRDGIELMRQGYLDVTVFQDAAGQGAGALDTALMLARGKKTDRTIWVPFQLITPTNVADFVGRN